MNKKGLQVDEMATYRIKIQGSLDEEWSTRLYGLVIRLEEANDDELAVTVLTGQLPDQDALKQVLNTLYNLRVPLLSLEYLEEEKTESWRSLNDEDDVTDGS